MAEKFCELLEKAITDEEEAIKGYQKFRNTPWYPTQMKVEDINDLILEPIKKDEEKHLETLKKLNERICK